MTLLRTKWQKNLGEIIQICQLNPEGLRRAKSECISTFLLDQNIDMTIIQEIHKEDGNQQHIRSNIYKLHHTATDLNIHQVVTNSFVPLSLLFMYILVIKTHVSHTLNK